MLNEVFRYAVTHKEKIIEVLHYHEFEDVPEKARKNWIDYAPKRKDAILYGIDSSYNTKKYQGLELSVVDADNEMSIIRGHRKYKTIFN